MSDITSRPPLDPLIQQGMARPCIHCTHPYSDHDKQGACTWHDCDACEECTCDGFESGVMKWRGGWYGDGPFPEDAPPRRANVKETE